MSRRRTQRRRALKRSGLVASVLFAVAWGVSVCWSVWCHPPSTGWLVACRQGGLTLLTFPRDEDPFQRFPGWSIDARSWNTPGHAVPLGHTSAFLHAVGLQMPSMRNYASSGILFHRWLPFWLPVIVTTIPTGVLVWLERRFPRGRCQTCGYDLTGNVSGVCPECGEGV